MEFLIEKALQVRKKAYAPYSNFSVGAALETIEGKIFTGCNIENVAFSPTMCAERVAFSKAISEGNVNFRRIVIVGGQVNKEPLDFCPPCGVCRQVMTEFCEEDFEIIMAKTTTEFEIYLLADILPMGFG